MHEKLVAQIITAYGLDVSLRHPMQTGYRNKNFPLTLQDGTTVNLILYKPEPGIRVTIKNANALGDFLCTHNFPARHTYDSRILRIAGKHHEQYAALYHYLPGTTISWDAYTMKHLKALGTSMSTMHALLAAHAQNDIPSIETIYGPLLARMRAYFQKTGVASALQQKLNFTVSPEIFELIAELVRAMPHLPHKQPLHLDFVRSNILFDENTAHISGIVDFEKAAFGNPIFDIARTLAFLYVDCAYKDAEHIRKYFLWSGYQKQGPASYQNLTYTIHGRTTAVLSAAINMFLFYDFYKFLLHNPYESLPQNNHFVRTVALLRSREVL